MASSLRCMFLFCYILVHLAALANIGIAQPDFILNRCYNDRGNYTDGSNYKTNLNSLLSSLASNTEIDYGFYNLSAGQTPDQVNAIALCRGDVALDDCRGCVTNATREILQVCPNQKDTIGFYDFCMLRYSNGSIFGVVDKQSINILLNPNNVTESDVSEFNQALRTLMDRLRGTAASGSSTLKFATGSQNAGLQTIFGLVQCTPDLSRQDCDDCLIQAISDIPREKIGGQVLKPSCILRFEIERFYGVTPSSPPPSSPPPSSPPPSEGKKSNKTRTVVIIVVSTVSVLMILVICIFIFLRVRKPRSEKAEPGDEMTSAESLQFDFDTIRVATNDFSADNKLGQGGFGAVYKGTLFNGQHIAVKRLSMNSGQGDLEFKNEVLLVAKLQHRNLVRLLGFCLEGNERLLIYEFLPNTSLDNFIFDPVKSVILDWDKRYKIIGGIARGLLYLHEDSRLRIIHRDLKASNILLDEEMNPKISDFGMARLFVMDQTQGNTSRIVGTYGYMAPEYAMHGQFSVKSDVYSFGMLVLEIVSGQKNNFFRQGDDVGNLATYAWRNWREGTALNLVDSNLRAGSRNELMRCIHIGLLCVQENVAERPTMASVVLMLNSYSLTLPVPSQPAFFLESSRNGSEFSSSLGYNSEVTGLAQSRIEEVVPLSRNDVSMTELYPR